MSGFKDLGDAITKEVAALNADLKAKNERIQKLERELASLRACVSAADMMDESDGESIAFDRAQKAYGIVRAKVRM